MNVTKAVTPQFLHILRFLGFKAKIVRLKIDIFGGPQNQERFTLRDRALQTEQKNVLHQSLNFPR